MNIQVFTLSGALHSSCLPATCHSVASAEESSLPVRGGMILNLPPLGTQRKTAFTLAETLITLLVIGVVAAITIPALMTQINEYVLNKQRTVFERKFEEGLKQMRVDGKLEQEYSSTEDFVNEMKKYFKIAQVCDKNSLTKCFPEKFTYDENVTYQIIYGQKDENGERQTIEDTEAVKLDFITADLKTNGSISTVTGVKPKYDSNVIGVIFSDGARMLLTYNPNCTGITSTDTNGNTKKCFGYFADVNSKKSPNLITRDIITNIQMENLGFEIASVGAVSNSNFGSFAISQETPEIISQYNLKSKFSLDSRVWDAWAGAMIYCQDLSEDGGGWHLANEKQLTKIAKLVYGNANCQNIDIFSGEIRYQSCDTNKVQESAMWALIQNSTLWANISSASNAYNRTFNNSGSRYSNANGREYSIPKALCVR